MKQPITSRRNVRALAALVALQASITCSAATENTLSFRDTELIEFGADQLQHTTGGKTTFKTILPSAQGGAALLQFTTPGKADTAIVESPPIAIEPGKSYRIQAILKPVRADTDVKICVWAREFDELGKRPLQPYPRTSVSARAVRPHQLGRWTVRSLTFTAKANAHFSTAWVSVAGTPAEIHIKSIRILDLERATHSPSPKLAKLLEQLQDQAGSREPVLPRTLVFSRAQMKYGLERNYMRRWIDRPLLVDRATRVPKKHVTPYPSYLRIIDVVRQYGLDGLAFFPETKGRMGMFELTERASPLDFSLLPEFIPTQDIAPKKELLRNALSCPQTVRINGKVLITSYVASALSPSEWQSLLDCLRHEVSDQFLFLPALTAGVKFKRDFQQGIPIVGEEIEECKAYLRSYLDVCDGIYFYYAAALKREDRTFDEAFYRELFIPIYKSVLAEPAYRTKLLGLSAYHSHYNADLSLGLQEDGTKTLRHSLSAALDARPDVVILPEWDEVNENTCIRPTAYNSFASQRIIRYHMNRIKGVPCSSKSGDNTAIPDLIISYRKILTLGETLAVELLNVPDSDADTPYRVSVSLADHKRNEIHRFAPVELNVGKLEDRTLTIPTERFADYPALIPRVTVEGYKAAPAKTFNRGLHHIQLRTTWNWDYKYVKQPLRDLIDARQHSFVLVDQPSPEPGTVDVTGTFACDEPIALAEVLEDDDVVYAVDPTDEFARDSRDKVRLWIEFRSLRSQQLKGTLSIEGTTCEWRFGGVPLHQPAPTTAVRDSRLELDTPAFCHLRWIYAIIPRQDVLQAALVSDFNLAKLRVPVSQLLKERIYSQTFRDGLTLTICDYWKQPDMPHHLDRKTVSFTARIRPEIPTAQLHMRITAKSGRTFRTAPLLLPAPRKTPVTTLPVYSDTKQRAIDVSVPTSRIPDCRYEFTQTYGDLLYTPAGRPFWASLGGYIDTTSGRGGNGGGASATLFRFGTQDYPQNAHDTAPTWTEFEGATCLEFDGIGNYILFPRETLPRRGPFTISFEVRPTNVAKPQVLFAHRTRRIASLTLHIKDGKLGGAYYGEHHAVTSLNSELDMSPNEWSRVVVSYDFRAIRIRVNDREESFPCQVPGLNIGPCVFGGYGTGGDWPDTPGNQWWFEGLLKNFRIHHAPRL